MTPIAIALIGIRGAALALSLGQRSRSADVLYAAADAIEAGQRVDAHMEEVAALLKNRHSTDTDYQNALSRLRADSDRLQG